MSESAVRFTVQDSAGRRGATWKCWSPPNKDDVYIACRELRGALKTSLHGSGRWHVAFLEGVFAAVAPDEHQAKGGRYIERWGRPAPMAPGVTLALRIVTPWSSTIAPGQGDQPSIISVPAPGEGKAIEFLLVLVDKPLPADGWPGKNTGTQPVGFYRLPSGVSVWILWREIHMPSLPSVQGTPQFFPGMSRDDLKEGTLGLMLFGTEADGSRVIYDCVARYEGEGKQ